MAQYPIKMLKDEEKEPFVPLVAPEAVIDNNNENLVQKLAKKINEPVAEGTNGQVLATDGNGERFWTTVQGGGGQPNYTFYNIGTSGMSEEEWIALFQQVVNDRRTGKTVMITLYGPYDLETNTRAAVRYEISTPTFFLFDEHVQLDNDGTNDYYEIRGSFVMTPPHARSSQSHINSYMYVLTIIMQGESSTVSSVEMSLQNASNYLLETDKDYSTPYTPLYDGSPATKKYVDDSVGVKGQVLFYNGLTEQEIVETDSDDNYKILSSDKIAIKDTAFSAWTIGSDGKSLNVVDDKIKRIKITYICTATIGDGNPSAVIGIKINNEYKIETMGGKTGVYSMHNLCCEGVFDINAGDIIRFQQKTRDGGKYGASVYSIIIEALN